MSLSFCQIPESSLLPQNFSRSFLALFIYLANIVTPDTVGENLLAAPLAASSNTQLLVCKSNAEQKISFTCVVTITEYQNICD